MPLASFSEIFIPAREREGEALVAIGWVFDLSRQICLQCI